MSMLIVETGLGVEGANSYVTVAQADDYIALFLPELAEVWADESEQQKEVRLIRAGRFMDTMTAWKFDMLSKQQGLVFPPVPFEDKKGRLVTAVPQVVKDAQITLAASSVKDHLTTDFAILVSEKFGDTQDVYSETAAVKVGGNSHVREWINFFSRIGYSSNTSQIEFERS